MDKRMYESLKFDRFPEINFSLYRVEKIVPINGKGDIFILGFLEIAGKKKLDNLLLSTQKITDKTIQISLTKSRFSIWAHCCLTFYVDDFKCL
ncbi:MAG: hypothetical protein WD431_02170 [Cyclobacteriaceae bacterium]